MTAGICDFAAWRPVGTFGYPGRTRGQNKPLFFVDHIMAGWKSTMDRPGWQDSAGISAHFGIGKDGSISQYVNIFDASYANGLTGTHGESRFGIEKYDRANRHLAAVENTPGARWVFRRLNNVPYWNLVDAAGGISLLNACSITIEHEGLKPEEAWTDAMVEADIVVKFWCLQELQRQGFPAIVLDNDAIVGHHQIDPVNRPNCPGAGRPRANVLQRLIDLVGGVTPVRNPEPVPVPDVEPAPPPPPPDDPPNGGQTHIVEPGETLWRISVNFYGSGRRWRDILDANEALLHGGERKLRDGMEIRIP